MIKASLVSGNVSEEEDEEVAKISVCDNPRLTAIKTLLW